MRGKASGVPGVSWDIWKERWRARLHIRGERTHIGWYATIAAARAALESARLYARLAGEERKDRIQTTLLIDGKPIRGTLTLGYGRISFDTTDPAL